MSAYTSKRVPPVVLTIAGSDPTGGAGIQADLRTFGAMGVHGVSVATALTAQSTHGVDGVYPVDAGVVQSQLTTLLDDIRPDAVKIGMLGTADQVHAVAEALRQYSVPNVVLDPVLASTGGVPLLDKAGVDALKRELLPLTTVVTPNWHEAEALTGIPLTDSDSLNRTAAALQGFGAKAALIKGGHRPGDAIDTLFADGQMREFHGHRIDTVHTHGAGCFLSSAIAARLAVGDSLIDAVCEAKRAFIRALKTPVVLGSGRGYPALSGHPQDCAGAIRGLYVLTDPILRPDRSPIEVATAALAGGATILQMRDKNGSTPEMVDLARRLRDLCREAGALFFVNDRVDIALAAGADGVHLGPDDMAPADVRRIAPTLLIGVSVSSVNEAAPLAPYADYFGVGAIYGSSTKLDAGAPVGTGRIREIKAAFPHVPIVAIGGVGAWNIADVIDAGADSVAVISAVIGAGDMEEATRTLAAAFDPDRPKA